MEINTSNFAWAIDEDARDTADYLARSGATQDERKDLESVVTHEAGHYIGLAHSNAPLALMNPGYCSAPGRCESGQRVQARRLSADEIAAVCDLYKPVAPTEFSEDASGCQSAPENESAAPMLMFVGAIAALLRRYNARRSGA
jgi:uncharacterized protein (TIGR03382 family)